MEQWDKSYYISSVAGSNNGSSIVVMSKGTYIFFVTYIIILLYPHLWQELFVVAAAGLLHIYSLHSFPYSCSISVTILYLIVYNVPTWMSLKSKPEQQKGKHKCLTSCLQQEQYLLKHPWYAPVFRITCHLFGPFPFRNVDPVTIVRLWQI
jgi:hypothetical protein